MTRKVLFQLLENRSAERKKKIFKTMQSTIFPHNFTKPLRRAWEVEASIVLDNGNGRDLYRDLLITYSEHFYLRYPFLNFLLNL